MAEEESVLGTIKENINDGLSGDSGIEEIKTKATSALDPSSSELKPKRLFGRERPVHNVLGGGKPADIILWRNKKLSAGLLGTATAIWLVFEVLEFHLLTFFGHCCIVALALLFLWSNASAFIHKSAPRLPSVCIPEEPVLEVATTFIRDLNNGLSALRDVASGSDLKKFLIVIASLWVLSIVGSWCNFLTLVYIVVILLHTVPFFYEKYDHKVDSLVEKAMVESKKQYGVFDSKVLSKVPRGPLKLKKKD